jgi:topoisomerase-4 subunit A
VPGTSPDQTLDALFAFTQCEVPLSPNACVIKDGKPQFLDVKEILRISTQHTLDLIRRELEIRLEELREQLHYSSLEKIFIEHKIYRKIETAETWEQVIEYIDKGLAPFTKKLVREVTRDDIIRLTEIRIKRISRYDAQKADEQIIAIETEIEEVSNHLDHLVDFAILYFEQIRKKYGKGRERKTEIRNFDTIEAASVAAASQKLYINREEGFAGTSLKKDEYICDCSDLDDVILFREDGTCLVRKVESKFFAGKDIVYINVFKKNDERTIYNMIYRDGKKRALLREKVCCRGGDQG